MNTDRPDDPDDRTERVSAGPGTAPAEPEAMEDATVAVGPDDTVPVPGLSDGFDPDGSAFRVESGSAGVPRTGDDAYIRSVIRGATGEGLDPERRVGSAPGGGEGEQPSPEPGVRHRLPIVYGARTAGARAPGAGAGAQFGFEGSGLRSGLEVPPPPVALADGDVLRAVDRAGLPSVARRERRSRAVTRAVYAAVCLAALLGLCLIGVLLLR